MLPVQGRVLGNPQEDEEECEEGLQVLHHQQYHSLYTAAHTHTARQEAHKV